MTIATENSWKREALPTKIAALDYSAFYTDSDAEKMMEGFIPSQMEDKWFIYFHQGWLYFLRSWTCFYIYALRLDGSPAGVRVIDSWVNRDKVQYQSDNDEYDRKLVTFLIDTFLLKKQALFPKQSDQTEPHAGVIQHHIIGRNYPETNV